MASGQASGSVLPAYIPQADPPVDLPSAVEGRVPAYAFKYPAEPEPSVSGPVGSGGKITGLVGLYVNPPPPELSKNKHMQAINKAVNATIELQMAPSAQYSQKLSTVLASGQIPDTVAMLAQPNMLDLLQAKFADLTAYLSGDKAKDYPNLANIPSQVWRTVMFGKSIFGVPQPRPLMQATLEVRSDICKQLGVGYQFTNGQELIDFCKSVTDAGRTRYASGSPTTMLTAVAAMCGAPNVWSEDGGRFTAEVTTDEYKRALGVIAQMWKMGVFHPDSFAQPGSYSSWLAGGRTVIEFTSSDPGGWVVSSIATSPTIDFRCASMPKWDGGGQASYPLASGAFSTFTALKKASSDRIEEILRVLNWLAGPWGSLESTLVRYGVEGVDWTRQGDTVALTERGKGETVEVLYLACSPIVYFNPSTIPVIKAMYTARQEWQKSLAPAASANPAIGLYSESDTSLGVTLAKTLSDAVSDVIQGRKNLDDWDNTVQQWRKQGGDKIAAEYEAAFAASN